MAKIYKSFLDLVGNTPLLELSNYNKKNNLNAKILAKVELFNPAGSIKDRIAKGIILDAIDKGLINKDTTIIEPTSGNTGIGLAAIGASLGLKVVIVMPDSMSVERRNLIKAYGAELVLTEGSKGMAGAVEKANELHKADKNTFIAGQFDNPVNPQTHFNTTGPEIWDETDGNVDILVAGIGTGGTISGIGKFLKSKNPNIKVIAVEPETSPILTKGYAGPHQIQGIGANFVPKTLNTNIYDEIIDVPNEEAFKFGKELGRTEGILVGISSGAALYAATLVAKREENKGKNIVVIFPDTGDRYLSTPLFQ